ncbi:dihydropteroate synthase [bacterium SCSIO 12643]|nr:dihydropteroate synthase [bacterium SCSIO 12643]
MQDKLISKKTSLNFRGNLEDINRPQIMGILNATPDSFYDGGKHNSLSAAIENVKKMLESGADIIDLGAYSSRPGANHISEQEEIDRMLPVLTEILKQFPQTKISVDTFRSKVAETAIEAGALMINDISAGNMDPDIWSVAAKYKVPYVAMHMQGTPQTMQKDISYNDVLDDIILELSKKINLMTQAGIYDIIIDPGFGFGKTLDQNYHILKHLKDFEFLGHPLLVGVSRKSMIYKLFDSTPQEALNGTTAIHMWALNNGASFLRVHDIKEARETITIWEKLKN